MEWTEVAADRLRRRSRRAIGTVLGPLAMALALAACGGGGGRRGEPSNSSTTRPSDPSGTSTSGPPTTPAPSSRPVPPAGSVAFTVVGVTLSEPGLRVLVGASGGAITVVARGVSGGSNGVRICPVNGVSGAPAADDCVVADDGGGVSLAVAGGLPGVLLRAPEGTNTDPIRVAEVTLIYVPDGDQITVVTPPLAPSATPGECSGGPCQTAFELSPTGRGAFSLRADGRGARPQLSLVAGQPGGSTQVISIVEGGGSLAIRSTVDGRSDATLTLRNLGDAELPPLELALVWPVRR
jgi:hypothetical protein